MKKIASDDIKIQTRLESLSYSNWFNFALKCTIVKDSPPPRLPPQKKVCHQFWQKKFSSVGPCTSDSRWCPRRKSRTRAETVQRRQRPQRRRLRPWRPRRCLDSCPLTSSGRRRSSAEAWPKTATERSATSCPAAAWALAGSRGSRTCRWTSPSVGLIRNVNDFVVKL